MTTAAKLPAYFEAREEYLRAMALYEAHQKKLFQLFCVNNAADLEEALLEQRHLHAEERLRYEALAVRADRAADRLDLATAKQRQKIAAQQSYFNSIIANLDE